MSRSFGATAFTTRSPMRISPRVSASSPAIVRSNVDLPHPEGPTSTTNSLSATATETSFRTGVVPNTLWTWRTPTEAIARFLSCRFQILRASPSRRLLGNRLVDAVTLFCGAVVRPANTPDRAQQTHVHATVAHD